MTAREVAITDVTVGNRHRKNLGDIGPLADSIAADGLLQPIVLTPDHELIAGKRRLEAFKLLKRATIPATIIDIDSIVRGEFVENALRKDLTVSEKVAIGAALEVALGERRGRPGENIVDACPQLRGQKTRDVAAERAKAVVDAAGAEPERYGHLVEYMDRTNNVAGTHRRLQIEVKAEGIRQETPPLPDGSFRVIVADPPWPYGHTGPVNRRGVAPYPEMTLDEICALNIAARTADDCVLWLWTTNAHLRPAFDVLDPWGRCPSLRSRGAPGRSRA